MPHKHNAAHRHHIGKMKFKVTNWAEYDAGLRQRWQSDPLGDVAVDGWAAPRRKTKGGQPRYCDLAIETALTLGLVFGLRLRQAEGFVTSVLQLMGLDLAVPDHTTLSRRANKWRSPDKRQDHRLPGKGPVHVLVDSTGLEIYGAGQWLEEKHGAKAATNYGKRSLVETAIGRYKSIIGHRLRARSFAAQQTEVAIGCTILNRMLACARPKSVRHLTATG